MHQAPTVDYPLGDARMLRHLIAAVWLLVLLVDLAWLYQVQGEGWRVWFGLGSTLVIGLLARRYWPGGGRGSLRWDGTNWCWQGEGQGHLGHPEVQLDLQSRLLVRWSPVASGRSAWFWLDSAADPSAWLDLRRAVFAAPHAGYGSGDDGAPAALVARP